MKTLRILVPVTLSDGSLSAVLVAARLAGELSAGLVLLHALPKADEAAVANAREQLAQLARRARLDLPFESAIEVGHAAQVIARQAAALPAAAIVMTSRHGGRQWSWLHRGTARAVLRGVSCPVWVVAPGPQGLSVELTRHECPELALSQGVVYSVFAPGLASGTPAAPSV